MPTHGDAPNLLRENGIRATRQRLTILTRLLAASGPISAGELHTTLNAGAAMDLVTVYRTLHTLRANGLAREIPDRGGTTRYEASCGHKPMHPHFRCVACRRLYCLKALRRQDARRLRRLTPHFHTTDITITMSGTCAACAEVTTEA